ncbi:hypothetical protein FZC79_17720 [Rossellomorea vietnamensis]|uniref:Uncharacterized protein n=1 Tax=Rossellomorea vietnamensis TaxID=218284 RepID=A0A5D4KC57_9BACI|nr:hypothetical protein [Rossellomorea vietnamensis]TYR73713.1 hypothetical protein FZC79_17720 [Rossellomorea vietnamensis]
MIDIGKKYEEVINHSVKEIYVKYPELDEKFGERGRQKCYEDNVYHFQYLETSAGLGSAKVFTDYALWLNSVLVSRGMSTGHLIDNFRSIITALEAHPEVENGDKFTDHLHQAIYALEESDGTEEVDRPSL